jgi:hypothetical protein
MNPEIIKNVLSVWVMLLMVLLFTAVIAVSITNTIYYKRLWDENGSESISQETAKTFFFVNLTIAILSLLIFLLFLYRWYKLYNISSQEYSALSSQQLISSYISSPQPINRSLGSSMTPSDDLDDLLTDTSPSKTRDTTNRQLDFYGSDREMEEFCEYN